MPQWTTFDAHAWRDAVATASAKEGVEAALAEIDRVDGTLNAFSVVLRDSARKQAIQLDQLDPSARGPLHGGSRRDQGRTRGSGRANDVWHPG